VTEPYDSAELDVSVIIPARNAAKWIGEQLYALSRQTFDGEWEVIVVDNGSTDATAAVARSWVGRVTRLRVVDAPEQTGANFARNHGVRVARGRLLLFCDADDRASSTWVERMARASERADFLGGPLDFVALNSARQRAWYGGETQAPGVRPWDGYLSWVTSANLGITAALAERLGPFDTRFVGAGDDIALSWRVTLLGTPPTEVPDAVMHYRFRPAGLAAWRHQYVYAKRMVTLYREFAPMGMPRREWKEAWGSWRYTLIRSALAPLLPPAQRRAALRELAYNVGKAVGSAEERTLFL
jgi:glycosyltransferase involved in cell wall biosynthesis